MPIAPSTTKPIYALISKGFTYTSTVCDDVHKQEVKAVFKIAPHRPSLVRQIVALNIDHPGRFVRSSSEQRTACRINEQMQELQIGPLTTCTCSVKTKHFVEQITSVAAANNMNKLYKATAVATPQQNQPNPNSS